MSNYKIIYSEVSKEDLVSIVNFYKNIDISLGISLKEEVYRVEKIIKKDPEIYRIRFDNVRRVNLKTFPFCIFYEIEKDIKFLRILHQSRDPINWPFYQDDI